MKFIKYNKYHDAARIFSGMGALGTVLSIGLLHGTTARAEALRIAIEPVVGYEQTQILLPTPHTTTRLTYGATATVGVLLISGEAQYLHGSSSETYPDLGLTQTHTTDRIRLGLRSGIRLGSLLTVFFRGGAEGSQERIDQTVGGVLTTSIYPLTIRPYAGVGARASLGGKIYATADVTAVIVSLSDLTQTQYTATAGFGISLP